MEQKIVNIMYMEMRKNLLTEIEEVSNDYFIEKKKLETATKIKVNFSSQGYLNVEQEEDFTIDLIKKNLSMLANKFEQLGTRYNNLEYNYRDLI